MSIVLGLVLCVIFLGHHFKYKTNGSDGPVTRVFQRVSVGTARIFRQVSMQPSWNPKDLIRKTSRYLFRPSFDLASPKVLAHWLAVNFLGPLLSAVSVERMLVANRLSTSGITDWTGQMIALLTGITNLCVALWNIFRRRLVDREETKSGQRAQLLQLHAYLSKRPLDESEMGPAV
ncbi:hypothetical protein B0T14DRAFT_566509 [Immersiella caudata]|uniref:Uncharacterized protein n=1 Tax=Immersiella caudata TaxID=314043 RepID=A0AA39WQE5_9PEZI|nr:hypothetical protein B0T14DRAFT_566509 [Immersiella caudata]